MRHFSAYFRFPRHSPRKRKNGAILFVAIATISVLSILTVGTTANVMQQLKLARRVTNVHTTLPTARTYMDVLRVVFANNGAVGGTSLYNLRSQEHDVGEYKMFVSLSDEERLINVKTASHELLKKIPGLYGIQGDILIERIGTADLIVKEDLLLVDGMDEEVYEEIKPLITVYGSGAVNLNTADAEIMELLGMDEDLIEMIEVFRAGEDEEAGTADDGIFSGKGNILNSLEKYHISSFQRTTIENLLAAQLLGTASNFIRVRLDFKKGSRNMRSYSAILRLNDGKIIQWDEA